ncbi:hypothetical protein P153DRAFT_320073 [Dothidotthia symphoricarpi CBS 119687]|uniref:N-acetyltransferase domain-containing protein n=1 Tax=Dothidotthia symphoricarpi CBS 119687 TaxID=1392245 RepID=A0A6A6A7Z3_9PLEO|nr:uncharacterized protein P153DRAFT_320073 [Dothidotthia symphoricarpi CBS 119687]KAF2127676.1 hypothetical protein P153DRAFT_320073 [Dothidotthia symphoricarpi CBS 119687]
MDPTISTPRLNLTLITTVERGSPELAWLHELRSDVESTWWSINGNSKSLEDTEKFANTCLPADEDYIIAYAVHEILPPTSDSQDQTTQFIGLVTLKACGPGSLPLPEDLTLPASAAATTLTTELVYQFLPKGWGKGYATEAVNAVFEAGRTNKSFWAPYEKVYVRAIVNDENLASRRVMAKVAMKDRGIYEWTGGPVWLTGRWIERSDIHVMGMHLLE